MTLFKAAPPGEVTGWLKCVAGPQIAQDVMLTVHARHNKQLNQVTTNCTMHVRGWLLIKAILIIQSSPVASYKCIP
jgi:hypothetical protein